MVNEHAKANFYRTLFMNYTCKIMFCKNLPTVTISNHSTFLYSTPFFHFMIDEQNNFRATCNDTLLTIAIEIKSPFLWFVWRH